MNDFDPRELLRENATLSQQVKRLIKAEGKLYAYQEELDAQLKQYKDLYELTRKINSTFDLRQVFHYATEYVIGNLEYERVVFLQNFEDTGSYAVCALDGYYDPQEKEALEGLTISRNDPFLLPLAGEGEYVICTEEIEQGDLARLRARLLMDEYLVYPLGSKASPPALLAIGNSAQNAGFYRRVSEAEGALLGAGNFAGLLSTTVENYVFYTGMKTALEQERRAEARYRQIFENATEGIFQTSVEGKILNCNPATATILGYDTPEELMERITDIGPQLYVDPKRRTELLDLIRTRRNVKNFEAELYRRDGSRQWVLLNIRPMLNDEGKIERIDGIIQDIAERKRAETALQELNEELEHRVKERTSDLEHANRDLRELTQRLESAYSDLKSAQSQILQQEKMASIGQLAAGVAHEINNPMGFIISNLNSLRKYTEKISSFLEIHFASLEGHSANAELAELAEKIRKARGALKLDFIIGDLHSLINESLEGADRVKKIVQDMKSFSRLDESDSKLADLNEGIESTINIVWNEIKYKATLTKEYGTIPQIRCNPGQLNQVFMNIILNAAQAIEASGEITVRTFHDRDFVYIAIADTGKGIAADSLNRIFEPFFTTKEVGKGTGLGLSIAYDIVKKHSGEIRVESEIGKGTTFTIAIPAALSESTAV